MARRWTAVAVGVGIAALFGGRWLALATVDRLWAESLGIGSAQADVALLRLAMTVGAFSLATAWYVGNLGLLYRQIGAVQVPRQVGDLEIIEHVPRRYLLAGMIVAGVALAALSTHGVGDRWSLLALSRVDAEVGRPDPLLGRPAGYYLFTLPWERALHGFTLRLALVGGLLMALLYGAVGAIRRQERRLVFLPFARWHLAALSGTLALVLAWGAALEPAALVGGLRGVPFDAVLRDVRIPLATVTAVLGLITAAASLVWMRVDRARVPALAWVLLLGVGVFGRHAIPGLLAAGGRAELSSASEVAGAVRREALQLVADTVVIPLAVPDGDYAARHAADLAAAPVWDAFVLPGVLNRTARATGAGEFSAATLVALPRDGASPLPVFLAAREDTTAGRRIEDAGARGAVAVAAAQAGPRGRPLFLTALDRPDSVGPMPGELPLRSGATWFAPSSVGTAMLPPEPGVLGIAVRGWWNRIALAWALQAPALLSPRRVPTGTVVVVERSVGARLARYAPFARFGAAWPVLLDGRLVWAAWGYVSAGAFPAAPTIAWRGAQVRYLRADLVGTVDAASGATRVYLTRHADVLSRAWQRLLRETVQSADRLPAELASQLRYPEELFTAQIQVLRADSGRARAAEPFWWVGTAPGDSVVRLRLRAVDEVFYEPRVAAVLEGVLDRGGPRVRVLRYPEPYTLTGVSELERLFGEVAPPGAAVPGRIRLVPFEDGAVAFQSFYTDSGTFVATVAGWPGAIGTGTTVLDALRHLTVRRDSTRATGMTPLDAAREWFRQLDRARAEGDWQAFGEAWKGLRDALGVPGAGDRTHGDPRRN